MKSQFSTFTSWLLKTFGLAASYFVIGKFSLLLAIPPGYAAPIWPAAGIALGGILLFGHRLWPGIIIGSFLVNMSTSFDAASTAAIAQSLLLPLVIGTGAALQAIAGAFLIKRYVNFPASLDQHQGISKTMVFGAPLSCLISCTAGTVSLQIAGFIEGNFLSTWQTWWVGDTLGVLIIIPIILIIISEKKQLTSKARIWVLVPMGFLVALVLAVFLDVRKGEWEREQLAFEKKADHMAMVLKRDIQSYLEVLHAIEGFFKSSQSVTRQEFHIFVSRFLDTHPGIQALEWVPRVEHLQRQRYQKEAQDDAFPDFRFTELDINNTLITASIRPEYFPVYFVEPYRGNERSLGFDLASHPQRLATLQTALQESRTIVSPPMTLVQEAGNQVGALIFRPIYESDRDLSQVKQNDIRGFAVVVCRLGDMVDKALSQLDNIDMAYELFETSPVVGNTLLYSSIRPEKSGFIHEELTSVDKKKNQLSWNTNVQIAQSQWDLHFHANQDYYDSIHNLESYFVLTAGLFFSSLFGSFLLLVTGRTIKIEEQVSERTAELADEITQRKKIQAALQESQSELETRVHTRTLELKNANILLENKINDFTQEPQLSKANRAIQTVSHCNHILAHTLEEKSLLKNTCKAIVHTGKYCLAWIGYSEQNEKKTVTPITGAGFEMGYLETLNITWDDSELGHGPTGTAIRTKQPQISKNILTNPEYLPWREEAEKRGFASSISLPLISNSNTLGALNLYSKEADAFDTTEVQLLEEIAENLSYGITALRGRIARKNAELKVHESEKKFRDLVELAPDAIIMVGKNGLITLANKQVEALFGYTSKELQGKFHDILVPDQAREIHAHHRDTYFAGPTSRPMGTGSVLYGKRKDGSEFPVEISLSPLKTDEGTHIISIVRDMTERHKIQKELQIREERLAEAQKVGHLGSWDWNIIGEKFIWSDEMCRIFGTTQQNFTGTYRNFLLAVHKEDREEWQNQFLQLFKDTTLRA